MRPTAKLWLNQANEKALSLAYRDGRNCLGVQLQMGEYLLNHFGIFDAGNDLHDTAAVLAGGDMDIEYPFEPLSPRQRCLGAKTPW
jgi:hypothetical protein